MTATERDYFNNSESPPKWFPKCQLNLTYGSREDVVLKNFKIATMVAILDIRMEQFESPCCLDALHKVLTIRLTIRVQILFEELQDGSYLEYWNGTILAILNFHVAPMPPTKVRLNPTAFESRCGLKILKIAAMAAILDISMERL